MAYTAKDETIRAAEVMRLATQEGLVQEQQGNRLLKCQACFSLQLTKKSQLIELCI